MKNKFTNFSGNKSKELWDEINKIKTAKDCRWALYSVCCKLQSLEDQLDKKFKKIDDSIKATDGAN
jgi:hypothetical protein